MKKLQTVGVFTAISSALLLSGCNTVPQRSAGETFRMAVDKSLEKDTSYNFAIKQEVSLTPAQDRKKISVENAGYQALKQEENSVKQSPEDMMAACDKAFDTVLADESASAVAKDRAEQDYVTCLKAASKVEDDTSLDGLSEQLGGNKLKEAMTPARVNAINEYWLKPIHIELNGAVDTDAKRILLDYRLGFKPRNFTIAVNFPMMFDFDEMSFALDPALLLPFIGPVFDKEVGTSWNDKWVKFTLPEEYKKEVPAELVLTAFKNALKQSYTGIDDKYLSYSDKGTLGRQLGASQAVTMKMPAKQKIFLIENLITNWVNELEKEAAANPDAIKNPKTFNAFLKGMKDATAKGAILGEFEDLLSDDEFVNVFFGNAENTFFLNGSNSLVGMLGTQKITALADVINADINSKTITKITNHNRADFSMVPTGDNMVDGNALIEKFMNGEVEIPFKDAYKKGTDNELDDSSEDAATAIVE